MNVTADAKHDWTQALKRRSRKLGLSAGAVFFAFGLGFTTHSPCPKFLRAHTAASLPACTMAAAAHQASCSRLSTSRSRELARAQGAYDRFQCSLRRVAAMRLDRGNHQPDAANLARCSASWRAPAAVATGAALPSWSGFSPPSAGQARGNSRIQQAASARATLSGSDLWHPLAAGYAAGGPTLSGTFCCRPARTSVDSTGPAMSCVSRNHAAGGGTFRTMCVRTIRRVLLADQLLDDARPVR
jgi:hypothetical protein